MGPIEAEELARNGTLVLAAATHLSEAFLAESTCDEISCMYPVGLCPSRMLTISFVETWAAVNSSYHRRQSRTYPNVA